MTVAWSKTDQKGEGRTFGVFAGENEATDPVRTMRAWIQVRGKEPGPLFTHVTKKGDPTLARMSGGFINESVQRAVTRIGLDDKEYGAHSLRAGFVTAAADNGASDRRPSSRTDEGGAEATGALA